MALEPQQPGDWWTQNAPPGGWGTPEQGMPRVVDPSAAQTPFTDPATSKPILSGGRDSTGMPLIGYMPPLGGPSATSGQPVDQQSILALFGNQPLSPELLTQLKPQLEARGIYVQYGAGGLRPRLFLPDGNTVDLGDFGGQAKWVPRGGDWRSDPNAAAAIMGKPGSGQTGSLGGGSGGGGLLGNMGGALDTLRNTPGYQFALGQGIQGIERSAFAKGGGLTGGVLKAIQQYGTGLADQTYGAQYQRYLDLAKLGYPQQPS